MTQMFDRTLSGSLELVDDNTVLGQIVPWNEYAEIYDLVNDRVDHYFEAWEPGAFADQARSRNRGTISKIEFVETHTGGLGKVGYALELPEQSDGQWGLFRLLPRHREDVHQMIADGVDGLSMRFHPKRGGTQVADVVNGVQRRLRSAAQMVHVALVATPTWANAKVFAMREDGEELRERAEEERAAELAAQRSREALALIDNIEVHRNRWDHLLPSNN
jgi:phage head maturation protease